MKAQTQWIIVGLVIAGVYVYNKSKKQTTDPNGMSNFGGYKCPCQIGENWIYLDCKRKRCETCCEMAQSQLST